MLKRRDACLKLGHDFHDFVQRPSSRSPRRAATSGAARSSCPRRLVPNHATSANSGETENSMTLRRTLIAAALAALTAATAASGAGNPRFWTSDRVAKTIVAKNPQFLPGTPLTVVAAVCVGRYPPAAVRDPVTGHPASRNFSCAVQWLPAGTTGRVAPKRSELYVRPSSATAICWSTKSLAVLVANRHCGP